MARFFHAYSRAMDLAPHDVSAVYGVGEAYQMKKKNEAAMEYYDKTLVIESGNIWALYCKASLFSELFE